MRFVKRKVSWSGLLAVGDIGGVEEYARRHFEEFCRGIGGVVDTSAQMLTCRKETDAIGSITDYIDDFHSLVTDLKTALKRPVALEFVNRLLGGWEEDASVEFSPWDKSYYLSVSVYGEGVPPEEVEGVKWKEITREVPTGAPLYATLYEQGYVDQNPATDEYAGRGYVAAKVPLENIRSMHAAPELRQLIEKMISEAEGIAEEAREELIIPAEEAEEFY